MSSERVFFFMFVFHYHLFCFLKIILHQTKVQDEDMFRFLNFSAEKQFNELNNKIWSYLTDFPFLVLDLFGLHLVYSCQHLLI